MSAYRVSLLSLEENVSGAGHVAAAVGSTNNPAVGFISPRGAAPQLSHFVFARVWLVGSEDEGTLAADESHADPTMRNYSSGAAHVAASSARRAGAATFARPRTETALWDVARGMPQFRNRHFVAFRDANARAPPVVRVALYAAPEPDDVAGDGRTRWLGSTSWKLDEADAKAVHEGERVTSTCTLSGPGVSGESATVQLVRLVGSDAVFAEPATQPTPPPAPAQDSADRHNIGVRLHVCEVRNAPDPGFDSTASGTRVIMEVSSATDGATWASASSRRRSAACDAGYDDMLTAELPPGADASKGVIHIGIVDDANAVLGKAMLPLFPFAQCSGPRALTVVLNDESNLAIHASLDVTAPRVTQAKSALSIALDRWEPRDGATTNDSAFTIMRCEMHATASSIAIADKAVAPFARTGVGAAQLPRSSGLYVALASTSQASVWGEEHTGIPMTLPPAFAVPKTEDTGGNLQSEVGSQIVIDLYSLPVTQTRVDDNVPDVAPGLLHPDASDESKGDDIIARMLAVAATTYTGASAEDGPPEGFAASRVASFMARATVPASELSPLLALTEASEPLSFVVEAHDTDGGPVGNLHLTLHAPKSRAAAVPADTDVSNARNDSSTTEYIQSSVLPSHTGTAAIEKLLNAESDEEIARHLAVVVPDGNKAVAEGALAILLGDSITKQAAVERIGALLDQTAEANMLLNWKLREHKAKLVRMHAELRNMHGELEEERSRARNRKLQTEARVHAASAELQAKSKEELITLCLQSFEHLLMARGREKELQGKIANLKRLQQSYGELQDRYDELAGAHKMQNGVIVRQERELKRMHTLSNALATQEEVIARLEKVAEAGNAARRALTDAEEARDHAREELERMHDAAKSSAEEAAERDAQHEEALNAARKEVEETEARVGEMEKQCADAQAEIEAAKERQQTSIEELETAKGELASLREENKRLQDTVAEQDRQLLGQQSEGDDSASAKPATEPSAPEPSAPEPAASQSAAPEPSAPEPAVSQPTAPEPSAPEPSAPEPSASEPAVSQSAAPAPSAPEPAAPQPAAPEPSASEPAASQPAASEPAAHQPTASEPAAFQPAAPEPVTSEPTAPTEPAASQPAASKPAASQPAASELAAPTEFAAPQPSASEPTASEPVASQPVVSEPAATSESAVPQPATATDPAAAAEPTDE